jgi:uncharacterized protein (TIGR03437 family)
VLYATGEDATSPPGVDGKLAVPPYTVPVLPVSVRIDSIATEIEYKGGRRRRWLESCRST